MLKARVFGTGVNKMSKAQLAHVPQPLKDGMLDNFKSKLGLDGYEPIERIVDDFFLVHGCKAIGN